MTRSTLPAALVLAALLLPMPGAAQETKTTFREQIQVTEVLLDVLVTDKSGNVIVGLNQDDFIVEENGNPVEITGVAFYSNRLNLDEQARPSEVPADRYLIFFFHDQRRLDGLAQQVVLREQLDAARRTKEWIEKEMLGGDWVAVVRYDTSLLIHQDFTQDRQALIQAVEDAMRGKRPKNVWPSRRPEQAELAARRPSLLAHLPEGKALRNQTKKIYDGLRVLAEATADIQGRKSVLLFTAGFGELQLVSGATKGDPRFYPRMQQALNAHNVAVYPIDLKRSEVEGLQASFMNQLAQDTGGEFYDNVVNYLTPLRQIADENNGYYLLSYRAQHPAGEAGYQVVTVRTRNREFQVRARQGYRYGTPQG